MRRIYIRLITSLALLASLLGAVVAANNTAGISGSAFADVNGDGKWQSTEKAIAGVTIKLSGADTATAITDAAGHYQFPNLAPGNVTVTASAPAGFKLTTPAAIGATVTATNTIGAKNFGLLLTPAASVMPVQATTQPVMPQGVPVYYCNWVTGSDANNGSAAHPWKTARVIDHADVVLAAGQTFAVAANGLIFSGHVSAWVGSPDPATPAILSGEYLTQWTTASNTCTLANVTLTSPDGKGFGGNVRGDHLGFVGVNFGDLSEGLDLIGPCTHITITGGQQIGATAGRCWYFLDVDGLTWSGGHFGPASTQSPIRASSPGIRNAVITSVVVDQSKSTFPIAGWALHDLDDVRCVNCSSIGGEFSFNGAGAGVGDHINNCAIVNLTVTNSKFSFDSCPISNVTVTGGTFSNPTGECIAFGCPQLAGVTISGATLNSPRHGIEFYTATNGVTISHCTLNAPVGTPLLDGKFAPVNDGGGNVVGTAQ